MKKLIPIFVLLFSIGLVFAQLGYDSDNQGYGLNSRKKTTTTFNNNTGSVNSSDYWDNLDTPMDFTNIYGTGNINFSGEGRIGTTKYCRFGQSDKALYCTDGTNEFHLADDTYVLNAQSGAFWIDNSGQFYAQSLANLGGGALSDDTITVSSGGIEVQAGGIDVTGDSIFKNDLEVLNKLNTTNRKLYGDSSGNIRTTVDWNNGQLRSLTANSLVFDWNNGVFYDTADGDKVFDVEDRLLYDENEDIIINFTKDEVVINEKLEVTENVTINGADGSKGRLHMLMDSNDKRAIYVDGNTDYTENDGATVYVNQFTRDYNVGNEQTPGSLTTISSWNQQKHSQSSGVSYLKQGTAYQTSFNYNVYDMGNYSNRNSTGQSNWNRYGVSGWVNTNNAIKPRFSCEADENIVVQSIASDNTILEYGRYYDNGSDPALVVYNYGNYINIDNYPTVNSGTWAFRTYGLNVDLDGNGAGITDDAYGVYIDADGFDNMYSIYDVSSGTAVFSGDNKMIKLGAWPWTDMWIYSDGTNPVIKSESDGVLQILNSSGYGAIKASEFIEASTIYDKSKGNALEKIKDSDDYRKPDGSIDYEKHPAGVQVKVKDKDNCWEVISEYCINLTEERNGTYIEKESCEYEEFEDYDYVKYREECGTKLEWGLKSGGRSATLEQAVYELKKKNEDLLDEIETLKGRLDKLEK